jgi:hypothetical protein
VFGAALLVRWLSTGGDAFGDESFYLYLARTFGREPAAAVDNVWFHLLNRPLYYAIFHLGTYAGFAGFRCFGSLVASGVVALAFLVARALGASRGSALFVCAILAVERPLVEYGAHGFPDPLASGFALAAVWTALLQLPAATFGLALACVLSKESFVLVPFIVTCLRAWPPAGQRVRLDAWAWLSVLVPTAYVLGTMLVGREAGVAMQGWAQTPLSLKHARGMWVGPELWPLLVAIGLTAQRRLLVLWLGMPAFYVLWSWGLSRGLSPWYVIGPATLSAVASAPALDLVARMARPRWQRGVYAALALCFAPIAWSGVTRVAAQLREGVPKVHVAPEVVAILERLQPERVLLVNCFWSYGYSHLRGPHEPATRTGWPPPAELQRVVDEARAAQVTVMCRTPETRARDDEPRLAADGFETLFASDDYWVLKPR